MNEAVSYLDHGYVKLLDTGGGDAFISKFARCSFQNQDEQRTAKQDARLIDYLIRHHHTSPLEAGELWVEMKAPIFVFRQHMRHRMASLNEQSLRYSTHDGDYYIPELDRFKTNDKWNKQGSGDNLPLHLAETYRTLIKEQSESQWATYCKLARLDPDNGQPLEHDDLPPLTKELARIILGTNFYSTLCWKIDTKNLMNYLALRNDPHAQWEIQELAKIIEGFFAEAFPATYKAFVKHYRNSTTYTQDEHRVLNEVLGGSVLDIQELIEDWSDSRKKEFGTKLGFDFVNELGFEDGEA
ncbi:MAG: thymidylate synthase (FAD) [Acidobacteria bacterium]|nr:thymidylate synthase (FAD) [Acidobacteriota bacterium]